MELTSSELEQVRAGVRELLIYRSIDAPVERGEWSIQWPQLMDRYVVVNMRVQQRRRGKLSVWCVLERKRTNEYRDRYDGDDEDLGEEWKRDQAD